MTDDLITWLRAQLDEDESGDQPHTFDCELSITAGYSGPCTCGWSDRLDREVDAKRRILDDAESAYRETEIDDHDPGSGTLAATYQLRIVPALALPYADRPGYREAWRP